MDIILVIAWYSICAKCLYEWCMSYAAEALAQHAEATGSHDKPTKVKHTLNGEAYNGQRPKFSPDYCNHVFSYDQQLHNYGISTSWVGKGTARADGARNIWIACKKKDWSPLWAEVICPNACKDASGWHCGLFNDKLMYNKENVGPSGTLVLRCESCKETYGDNASKVKPHTPLNDLHRRRFNFWRVALIIIWVLVLFIGQ